MSVLADDTWMRGVTNVRRNNTLLLKEKKVGISGKRASKLVTLKKGLNSLVLFLKDDGIRICSFLFGPLFPVMDSNVCAFSMEETQDGGECRNCSFTINEKKSSCSNCDLNVTVKDKETALNLTPKKESSLESYALLRAKAWREKIRRDKLNERFADLYSILTPGNFRKCNKIAILSCATRLTKQLKFEVRKLKDKNISLQERIKVLKGEKMELRKEKLMLKAKKEKTEEMIKKITSTSEPQILFTATGQGNAKPYMFFTS